MVVYSTIEIYDKTFSYAKSDSYRYIADANGNKYVDVVYPLGDTRTFTETSEKIPDAPVDPDDATEADKDAALETLGVDMTEG